MLRQIITSPRFALADVVLVLVSGVIWLLTRTSGPWFLFLALLPWALRLLAGKFPFQRTPLDWLIAVFLITSWVGYWASYDESAAWNKVWFVVLAVLLYYALTAQPQKNLTSLSILSFYIGFGASIYFFLTHDFSGSTEKTVLWWMSNRPQTGWLAIHHGYISGLLVITNLFASYWLLSILRRSFGRYSIILKIFLLLGLGIIVGAFILTMSRGIMAAAACGLGVFILWKVITLDRFAARPAIRSLFPFLVLIYLGIIIAFVYLGPASAGNASGQSNYGTNTRAELFERGTSFLIDYPITGGGLNSFSGLYSQYILVIPFFYFANSYNIFLDVAIEQGLIGGLAFICIYLGSTWLVARKITEPQSGQARLFNWLSLFALIVTIVHGLFYDYLYNGSGTILLFFPVGISMIGVMKLSDSEGKTIQSAKTLPVLQINRTLVLTLPVLAVISISAWNFNKLVSIWYSNLGAIRMSQVELENFPANKWATTEILPELEPANVLFQSALRYDLNNVTANYRQGMIYILSRDFEAALVNLETAHEIAPDHRGIIKSLGYCYLWLGKMDDAQLLLEGIPESRSELEVYSWWWDTQGRPDLSANAFNLASQLKH